MYALSTFNNFVPMLSYRSLIESHLQLGSIVYGAANPKLLEPIKLLQRRTLRFVAMAKYKAHTDPLFKMYNILNVSDLINLKQT